MKKILFSLVPLLLSVVSVQAQTYLPLTPGNEWTYRDFETGSTFTVKVEDSQQIEGHRYFKLSGYVNEPVWVRYNEYGNLVYYNQTRQREELLTSFEKVRGAWFEAPERQCPQMGQVSEQSGGFIGRGLRFTATLDITYRSDYCADAGVAQEQYVPNIGMVTRSVNTIAGLRDYQIVYGKVARSVVVDAGPSANLSATYRFNEANNFEITIRLNVDARPMRLLFNSSQEVDVQIVNQEGDVLYTWSADKLFLPVVKEREVSGVVMWTVEIPINEANQQLLSPNNFVLAKVVNRTPAPMSVLVPIRSPIN